MNICSPSGLSLSHSTTVCTVVGEWLSTSNSPQTLISYRGTLQVWKLMFLSIPSWCILMSCSYTKSLFLYCSCESSDRCKYETLRWRRTHASSLCDLWRHRDFTENILRCGFSHFAGVGCPQSWAQTATLCVYKKQMFIQSQYCRHERCTSTSSGRFTSHEYSGVPKSTLWM